MTDNFSLFKKQITHPFKFRLFMFTRLPAAFFAGLHISHLSENESIIAIQQKWFNKNPFHSIYFAILSMAAEVSTGILCMGAIYKRIPAVSMLVVKNEGNFYKKATGKISFTCADGNAIRQAVKEAVATGEGRTVRCLSTGKNEQGEIVAEFYFTWSFKAKSI